MDFMTMILAAKVRHNVYFCKELIGGAEKDVFVYTKKAVNRWFTAFCVAHSGIEN